MRIDPLDTFSSPVSANADSVSREPAGAQATSSTLPQDTTSLSEGSLSVATLASQALAMASAMETRVNALRQAVGNGTYALEPSQIAAAMLDDGI